MTKKDSLADLLFRFLHEVLLAFFESIKDKGMHAFPGLMRTISKKLLQKYLVLAMLGITGLIMVAIGIAELLDMYMYSWIAYLIVGVVLLLLSWLQFKQ
tara:strand:+ start:834 stop:1130 length:297 start_codon:yes stop_codon:yes gene_type:complete